MVAIVRVARIALAIVIWLFVCLITVVLLSSSEMDTFSVVLLGFLAFCGFMIFPKKPKERNAEPAGKTEQNPLGLNRQELKNRYEMHLSDEQLIGIEGGKLPELYEQQLLLQPGECARYSCNAVLLITKQKAVGRTGGGGGVSVRVAKGVSLHSGGGSSRTIYGDVTERYAGRLVITDKRVVFLQQQKGFEQSIGKLTAMTPYLDGMDLQFGNKPYSLSVIAARYPVAVLRLILNGAGEEVIEEE